MKTLVDKICHYFRLAAESLARHPESHEDGKQSKLYISLEELRELLDRTPWAVKALLAFGAIVIVCAAPLSIAALELLAVLRATLSLISVGNASAVPAGVESESRFVRGSNTSTTYGSQLQLRISAKRRDRWRCLESARRRCSSCWCSNHVHWSTSGLAGLWRKTEACEK